VGENLAWARRQSSPAGSSRWDESPGHRANILEPQYRDSDRHGLPGARGPAGAEAGAIYTHVRRGRALARSPLPRGCSSWRTWPRRYGDVVALDGLSFTVEPGQLFGFVGPNGAGKTTTMRIVLGVLDADRGSVRWRGRRSTAARAPRFGYMPEERGLYPKMRVRDQLAYFASLHGARARRRAGGRRTAGSSGSGSPTAPATASRTLSLGNQQRVQLGRALVHDPELLVLDEPFSGLDPVGVDVLSGVLRELRRRRRAVVLLLAPARARGAAVRVGGDRQGRAAGGSRPSTACAPRASGRPCGWRPRRGRRAGSRGCPAPRSVDPRPATACSSRCATARAAEAVLDAARAAGTVTHFALERPTLSELFRQGGGGVRSLRGREAVARRGAAASSPRSCARSRSSSRWA
jgi:ABC-2 type transport system ATP-binding protein